MFYITYDHFPFSQLLYRLYGIVDWIFKNVPAVNGGGVQVGKSTYKPGVGRSKRTYEYDGGQIFVTLVRKY